MNEREKLMRTSEVEAARTALALNDAPQLKTFASETTASLKPEMTAFHRWVDAQQARCLTISRDDDGTFVAWVAGVPSPGARQKMEIKHCCADCGEVIAVHQHSSWQEIKDCQAGMRALCAACSSVRSGTRSIVADAGRR